MPRETFLHLPNAIKGLANMKGLQDDLRRIDKIAAVSQLASAVTHEIRNPLTAIQWNLQVLREKHPDDATLYDVILSELHRIDSMMNQMLSLAKANGTVFQDTDVIALTKTIVDLMSVQASHANVQIQFSAASVSPLKCDENQLKQVLINLLANAIDAMQDGGTIQVVIEPEGTSGVWFRVTDEGIGMGADVLARLGDPFFTTKPNGTGLGLMISRNIIQAHGGEFRIASKPNEGTTVQFMLPYQHDHVNPLSGGA